MIDTASWVHDYSLTFSHWLLVGGAVLLTILLTYRVLVLLGMKAEAATGLALTTLPTTLFPGPTTRA